MSRRGLRDCMQRFAERYQLRYLEKYKRFVALYRGIGLSICESDSTITLGFFCPSVDIGDQILEDFAGFCHCEEAGVPTAWIAALRELDTNSKSGQTTSHRGCVLQIYKNRLQLIGVEKFMEIPEIVARDLYEYGATDSWACDMCGQQQAATDAFFDGAYASLCNGCWSQAQLALKWQVDIGAERRKRRPVVRKCIAFAVIAAIIMVAAIIFWPRPGIERYISGMRALARSDYDLAIACFTEAIQLDPQFEKAWCNRGVAHYKKGDYDQALADYNEAIRLDAKNAPAYFNRGLACANKLEYDLAIADFTEAIRLAPNRAESYVSRAAAYAGKGMVNEAISDCAKAIELDPENPMAWAARGGAYYHKKEYDKAWEDVHKAQSMGFQVPPELLKGLREASGRER